MTTQDQPFKSIPFEVSSFANRMRLDEMTNQVSVIVPAFNAEATIQRTLLSAISQTYQNLQIIVVDDGSTDATGSIARRLAEGDDRITILHTQNQGSAKARNAGFKVSTGEFIAFLDADDLWAPRKVEKQVRAMRRAPVDVGLVYTWSRMIDMDDHVDGQTGALSFRSGLVFQQLLTENIVGNGSVALIKRMCLPEEDPFDPLQEGNEDILMYLKIARHWKFEVVPEFLVGYRWNTGSNQTGDVKRLLRSRLTMLDRLAKYAGPLRHSELQLSLFDCRLSAAKVLFKKRRYLYAMLTVAPALIARPGLLKSMAFKKAVKLGFKWAIAGSGVKAQSFHNLNTRRFNIGKSNVSTGHLRLAWLHNNGDQVHGGLKATEDANRIALTCGWIPFDTSLTGTLPSRMFLLIGAILRLIMTERDATFFVQLPTYGLGNRIVLWIIQHRFKNLALLHDIDELRHRRGGSSVKCIASCDVLIATGELMTRLPEIVPRVSYLRLAAWDYLIARDDFSTCKSSGKIIFAGNLQKSKVAWLYDATITRPALHLFGNGLASRTDLVCGDTYYGAFNADDPQFGDVTVAWALVWDGSKKNSEASFDTDYEYVNQPHKLSLYLACGFPVLVWANSAAAHFVEREGCGLVIKSLEEIEGPISLLNETDYKRVCDRAVGVGEKMRRGAYLLSALKTAARDV